MIGIYGLMVLTHFSGGRSPACPYEVDRDDNKKVCTGGCVIHSPGIRAGEGIYRAPGTVC